MCIRDRVGAAVSPYIMSYCLTGGLGWRRGYFSVSLIQMILTAILFVSLPLWKKRKSSFSDVSEISEAAPGLPQILRIKGIPYILFTFFAYCALESTAGLWASSYLVEFRGIPSDTAARFASLFYLGITVGRFLCGFFADKVGDKLLIRWGILISAFGVILIGIPLHNTVALVGLVITGLGSAPIYPSVIHATPSNFGKENSQAVIGIQMASAYTGSTFMPPLFGLIAQNHIGLYPVYLLFFSFLMLIRCV